MTGGRRDGSKLTQVRHGRSRDASWVECGGEQLIRSGHVVAVAVCERGCERESAATTHSKNRVITTLKIPRYRYEIGKLAYRSGNGVQNRNVR